MPCLGQEQIAELIATSKIAAISIDTSIVRQLGNNLKHQNLLALAQFVNTCIKVLISEIVIEEINKHIKEDMINHNEKLKIALQNHLKSLHLDVNLTEIYRILKIDSQAEIESMQQVSEFLEFIGAEVAPISDVLLKDVMADYFHGRAPFLAGSGKKNEFPDSVALKSLELVAQNNKAYFLIVSKDGDWKNYAKTSGNLIVVNDLSTALGYFNADFQFVAERCVALVRSGKAEDLIDAIQDAVLDHSYGFGVDADSDCHYEIRHQESNVSDFFVPDWATVSVIESDEETITLSFDIVANCSFEVSFGFSVRDSVDGDYISLGNRHLSRNEQLISRVFLKILKIIDGDDVSLLNVEIDGRQPTINFGYIEPYSV